MTKIFDTFDIDYDHVSFRYTASRVKEHVFVDRPDGIGVIQWKRFWESVKELYDSGKLIDDLIHEAEIKTSKEFDGMEDEIKDLRNEIKDLERDNDRLEERNDDLIYEVAELKARIAELEK